MVAEQLISLHGPMDTETLANELARQGALLQEAQQAVLGLENLTIQADQRSKVAEDKAIAAVTAISMVKIPDQKKVKLQQSRRRQVLASEWTRRASRYFC